MAQPPAAAAAPQRPALRLLDHFPQKFGGSPGKDAAAHWLEINDYWEVHNTPAVPPNHRVDSFRRSLKSKARRWIEGKVFNNIAELQKQFIEHFSGVHGRTATMLKLRSEKLQPGETLDDLLTRLRPLTDALNLQDVEVMDLLNEILPEDMKFQVLMSNPQNLNEYVDRGQRYIDLTSQRKRVGFDLQVTDSVTSQYEQMCAKLDTLCLQVSEASKVNKDSERSKSSDRHNDRSRDRHNDSSRDRYRDTPRDRYRDNSRDHYGDASRDRYRSRDRHNRNSRDRYDDRSKSRSQSRSPFRKPDRGTSGRSKVTCHYCKKTGHVWKQCYKLAQSMKDKPELN